MNYGKYEAERRLKSLHSKSGKYASRLLLNIFKALFVLFLFLAVVGASIGFGMVKGIIDNAPSVDILNIQPSRFATAVYDSAGNLTDTLVTSGSNREEATYEELPKDLINAFVSIEDSRFWSHNGIDIRSIARAVKGIVSDDYAGGGSTITQQLIKNNVFSGGMESGWGARIERKLQEQYLAVQLEKNSGMSKEDTKKLIITNYLNTINLGPSPSVLCLHPSPRIPPDSIPYQDAKTMRNAGESYSSICMSRVISPRPSRRKPWPMMYTTGYRTWIQPPKGLTAITAILRTNSLSRSSVP